MIILILIIILTDNNYFHIIVTYIMCPGTRKFLYLHAMEIEHPYEIFQS